MKQENFINEIKTRVGYHESDNKEEFIKAARIAHTILSMHYEKELLFKDNLIKIYEQQLNNVK